MTVGKTNVSLAHLEDEMKIPKFLPFFIILVVVGPVHSTDRESFCELSALPKEIGPHDRLYIPIGGVCSERSIAFSLERMGGPQGSHAVEFDEVIQETREYHHSGSILERERRSVLIITPMGALEIGARYRFSAKGLRTRGAGGPLLVSPRDWNTSEGIQLSSD